MDKATRNKLQKCIRAGMMEVLSDAKEVNKQKDTVPYVVDRIVAYVAKKMNFDSYIIIYKMLFDHIWEQCGYEKL